MSNVIHERTDLLQGTDTHTTRSTVHCDQALLLQILGLACGFTHRRRGEHRSRGKRRTCGSAAPWLPLWPGLTAVEKTMSDVISLGEKRKTAAVMRRIYHTVRNFVRVAFCTSRNSKAFDSSRTNPGINGTGDVYEEAQEQISQIRALEVEAYYGDMRGQSQGLSEWDQVIVIQGSAVERYTGSIPIVCFRTILIDDDPLRETPKRN